MSDLPLIARAKDYGERVALFGDSTGHRYSDLVDGSGRIARLLLDGESDLNEQRVAFRLPAGKDYIETQWGIWRAGGIAVPLSLSATEQELRYALEDSQASVLVSTSERLSELRSLAEDLGLRVIAVDQIDDDSETAFAGRRVRSARDDSLHQWHDQQTQGCCHNTRLHPSANRIACRRLAVERR